MPQKWQLSLKTTINGLIDTIKHGKHVRTKLSKAEQIRCETYAPDYIGTGLYVGQFGVHLVHRKPVFVPIIDVVLTLRLFCDQDVRIIYWKVQFLIGKSQYLFICGAHAVRFTSNGERPTCTRTLHNPILWRFTETKQYTVRNQ